MHLGTNSLTATIEVAQRVDELIVDAFAVVPEHLAPLRTSKRILRHDVLDGEVAAREVQWVLHVPAVLERGKQVEAALELVAVARPERLPELRVTRHAPRRPLLAQENRLIGLADVAAVVLNQAQSCNLAGVKGAIPPSPCAKGVYSIIVLS